jgi:probable HAF family extracellular repeat protein
MVERRMIRFSIAKTLIFLVISQICFAGASFQGFGVGNYATDISADGSTVVGIDNSTGNSSFKWSAETGITHIFSSDETFNFAYGVSENGSSIVGQFNNRPYYWTPSSGLQVIGPFAGGFNHGWAHGISDNGKVTVGIAAHDISTADNYEAFRWTEADGLNGLGYLPGSQYSDAKATNNDGSIIVGLGTNAEENFEAFRWSAADGMVGLGDLEGGIFESAAFGLSNDGSTIIGMGNSDAGMQAIQWTAEDGMQGLGDLEGGKFESYATEVSSDGSTILGTANTDLGEEVFYWTQETGMLNFKDMLKENYGLDLAGWRLTSVNGISYDGTKIIGNGINPEGYNEGWIITIPEPSAITLMFFAALFSRKIKK